MVVEGDLRNLQLGNVDTWCVNADSGLRELCNDIHDGIFRVGNREYVTVLIGKTDTMKGRYFPRLMEKILGACK